MIKDAIESLRAGKPILIHDSTSRENETDIVIPSQFISPGNINFMRKNGGGLICIYRGGDESQGLFSLGA